MLLQGTLFFSARRFGGNGASEEGEGDSRRPGQYCNLQGGRFTGGRGKLVVSSYGPLKHVARVSKTESPEHSAWIPGIFFGYSQNLDVETFPPSTLVICCRYPENPPISRNLIGTVPKTASGICCGYSSSLETSCCELFRKPM